MKKTLCAVALALSAVVASAQYSDEKVNFSVEKNGGTVSASVPVPNDFGAGSDGEVLSRQGTGYDWIAGGGGGAPTDATYIMQTANGSTSAEQALSSLATGLMKVTTTTGVISVVVPAAGIETWIATPSSANLKTAITDETGSGGALVFATSPALTTPDLGTPTALVLTNATGLPVGSITGLGAGVGSWLATASSANLITAMSDETGTGALVFANAPSMVGPIVGNGATGPGYVDFREDTDNGSNRVRIIGPASTADVDLTLPTTSGTVVTDATTTLNSVTGMLALSSAGGSGTIAIGGSLSLAQVGGAGNMTAGTTGLIGWSGRTELKAPADGTLTVKNNSGSTGTGIIQTGEYDVLGTSGMNEQHGYATELLTLSTGGLTTDTSANLLPANAVITGVVVRVTTTITTTTNWAVGDPTTSDRFCSANATLVSGTTSVCNNFLNPATATTDARGSRQAAAAKVRITCTGSNPGAGAIRIGVFYRIYTPPTS